MNYENGNFKQTEEYQDAIHVISEVRRSQEKRNKDNYCYDCRKDIELCGC